jgi:transposase-like protein
MAHSEEVRAAAMAALLQGQAVGVVAREYELPEATVSRWRKQARDEVDAPEVGELLLRYLSANLKTLEAQCEVFSDQEWLRTQDASAAGVLHGILCDKSIRLLEALSGGPMEKRP